MRQSTRLIVNTGATLLRMLLTVGVGLLTVRLLLKALGFSEFGVLTALAATGPLLAILTRSLGLGTSRHLAVEIGRRDQVAKVDVFVASSLLYGALALSVLLLALLLEPWLLGVLRIPEVRSDTAEWVFRLSIIGVALGIFSTPFRATLHANQMLVVLAGYDLLLSLVDFAVVVLLYLVEDESRLLAYAAMAAAARLVTLVVLILVCVFRCSEARYRWSPSVLHRVRRIVGFTGWTTLTMISTRLRSEGGLLILNVFAGPLVNAAYALSVRIGAYVSQPGFAVVAAVRPAVSTAEGGVQPEQVERLVELANKLPAMVTCVVLVPLLFEMPSILDLWLGEYPDGTILFARLVALCAGFELFSQGDQAALEARDRIIGVSLMNGGVALAAALVGAWLVWLQPEDAFLVPVAFAVATGVHSLLLRPWWRNRVLGYRWSRWWRVVALPIVVVGASGCGVAGLLHQALEPGLVRTVAVFGVTALVQGALIWRVGFRPSERAQVLRLWDASRAAALPYFRRAGLGG